MLKRWILFVLAIFAVQIVPPVPWVEVRAAGDSGAQQETGRQEQKSKSTLPMSVLPSTQTVISKKGTQAVASQEKEQGETLTRITAMPQVSVADKSKSRWDYVFDWGPWFFSLVRSEERRVGKECR